MKRLRVYLKREEAGTLEQEDSGSLRFTYSAAWLTSDHACPLSRSLPLQAEPFGERHARPFFAGILPEEGSRQKIASILGISERNDFAMLERIGGECAGAVALYPDGTQPPVPATRAQQRALSENDLDRIVRELPRRPLMAGEEGIRLSLAGAQDKLPVVMRNDKISLPLGDTPSSHIIKPEPDRFPGLVANERFCMTLARIAQLNAATVYARRIGDTPCIMVQRYDRVVEPDGTIRRVHQEDLCQALGIPPERKYQQEGGPLLRDCVSLLREWSTTPVLDIRDFVDGVIFNALIGNADAHGKNHSMLYEGDSRRLAPFYDLVCTLAWPELSSALAMRIGKARLLSELIAPHFRKMATECGLGWPMVRDRIRALCERVLEALDHPDLTSDTTDTAMTGRVAAIVSDRTNGMLRTVR